MSSEGDAVASTSAADGGVVDLPTLKATIEALSNQIRDLKASGSDSDKDQIPPLVKEMLVKKKKYADANGGIGVDGKKYEEPLSKSEKKKREREAKKQAAAAAAAGAASGGGAADGAEGKDAGDLKADPNSKGSLKKAAKKAEKAAKKAAAKKAAAEAAGSKDGTKPTQPGGDSKKAKAKADKKSTSAATTAAAKPSRPPAAVAIGTKSKLPPLTLSFNPNAALTDRPVMSLSVAVLTNTVLDYTINSDHNRHCGPGLGLPKRQDGGSESSINGGEICGDATIAKYVLRQACVGSSSSSGSGGYGAAIAQTLLGTSSDSASDQATIDQYVDYATSLSKFSLPRRVRAVASTLNAALATRTYVVGSSLTLADLALFASLGFPSQYSDQMAVLDILGSNDDATKKMPTYRWMMMIASHPAIKEATQLAVGITQLTAQTTAEAAFAAQPEVEPLMSGMSPLQGATPGNVVTRFPPEPSGYLHIGHAKAVLMNEYYARRYNGRLIARFDDTNPSKEKEEFQSSILEDLGKLGVSPDVVTFTSDYFETIREYALYMIRSGLAYMDDTPQDVMQKERMDRVDSKHRAQSPKEAMEMFELMCSGSEDGAAWCLRAKIDMKSVNGTMRDPVMYRQNTTPHHRSGTKYKAYPTYDLACPIVDSLEGVTHALRTTEYNDRDEQYGWIQKALGLRRVRIHSFARMNFVNTELSKRKLTWFVENGQVTGWDDPRFPTVRGVVRRGIDVTALRSFMCSQGASRRIVNMEWGKFWAENKKEIDKYSSRYMAIDKTHNVKLTVTNGPEADSHTYITSDLHPKDPSMGKRLVRQAKTCLIEKVDAEGLTVGQNIVLMRWGVVTITKINDDGSLEGTHDPAGDVKASKPKLSWLADVAENIPVVLTEFDNLITKDKLEEGDDFKDFINPHTLADTAAIGDAGLRNLKEHDIIQLERRGYYRVDKPYLSEDSPLVLFMVPDGKAKAMGGLAGKLRHS